MTNVNFTGLVAVLMSCFALAASLLAWKRPHPAQVESDFEIADRVLESTEKSICKEIRELDRDVSLWTAEIDEDYLKSYLKTRESLYGQYMAVNNQRRSAAASLANVVDVKEHSFSEL